MLAALTFAPWGHGTEGWKPSITGLGKVSIDGASGDEVAFLQDHTGRPGLVVLACAAVIVIAGLLAAWRAEPRIAAAGIGVTAALGAGIWTVVVLAELPVHLFDDAVGEALGDARPALAAGWGAIGVLVVSILILGAAATTLWTAIRGDESS